MGVLIVSTLVHTAAALGAAGTILSGTFLLGEPHVRNWLDETYAHVEVAAANSEGILLVRIGNAKDSGDTRQLRSLCDDYLRLYGRTPHACR